MKISVLNFLFGFYSAEIKEKHVRIELLMIEFFRKSRYPVVAVHSGASRRQRTTPSPSMDRQRTRIQNH